jgi:hypothetical protein
MTNDPTLKKRYRVVVLAWFKHDAFIEATDAAAAEAEIRRLWEENAGHEVFGFCDSGITSVEAEEPGQGTAS